MDIEQINNTKNKDCSFILYAIKITGEQSYYQSTFYFTKKPCRFWKLYERAERQIELLIKEFDIQKNMLETRSKNQPDNHDYYYNNLKKNIDYLSSILEKGLEIVTFRAYPEELPINLKPKIVYEYVKQITTK